MRYAHIIAGGSGTRLWPMSRETTPKQLIPFIAGRSLLQLSFERLEGLIPVERRYVGAGGKHRDAVLAGVQGLGSEQFISEPIGRDTLNAVGLGAAVLAQRDPDAVIGVFTADHLIEPEAEFRRIVARGFEIAEKYPNALVTFGIAPTFAATGYGYLELGDPLEGEAKVVRQFKEKPDLSTAETYFKAGHEKFLWNSGMFVWRAKTMLDCIRRFEPTSYEGLMKIAEAWDTPAREATLNDIFPNLKKISVDFAIMEPASRDADVKVVAVPMPLSWMDVGSWPVFAKTCEKDAANNALAADTSATIDTKNCLLASSEPGHLITTIGCENLLVLHTPNATLVCAADQAERIKDIHKIVGERFGGKYL